LRSIASVNVLPMYASARRFFCAPRLWIFLSSLQEAFPSNLLD